jgi:serine/threonine protein kinase
MEETEMDEINHHCLSPSTELFGGRYKIEKLVAPGGRGAIYRAIDTRFDRPRAVKEMLNEFQNETERSQAVECFERQATFLLDLNLSYLHRQSPPILFRDLKPSTIMVTGKDKMKLINFGMACTFPAHRSSTIILRTGYVPPEQLYGTPEPRSDLYALGATLHRVLTHHCQKNHKFATSDA